MNEIRAILSRKPFHVWDFDADANFTLGPKALASNDLVLREKGWTLFDLNFKNGMAIFLNVPTEAELAKAPFAYTAQYENATRVATMPLRDFVDLAQHIKPAQHLVHLFNIGHCGSTLLHHVFNASGQAWCISEPLFAFGISDQRFTMPPERLQELMRASLRFLSLFPGAEQSKTMVLKHFSQSTSVIENWYRASPEATCLYMYRDAESWCNSLFGFVQRMGMDPDKLHEVHHFGWRMVSASTPESFLDGIIGLDDPKLTFEEVAAVGWALHYRNYTEARQAGVPLKPFRYNELTDNREKMLMEIFDLCGLTQNHLQNASEAFEHDSHEGSVTAHDKPVRRLSEAGFDRVRRVLAHPRLAVSPQILL